MKTCDYCGGDAGLDVISSPDLIGVRHYSKIDCAEALKAERNALALQKDEAVDEATKSRATIGRLEESLYKRSEQLNGEFYKVANLEKLVESMKNVVDAACALESILGFDDLSSAYQSRREMMDAFVKAVGAWKTSLPEKRKDECKTCPICDAELSPEASWTSPSSNVQVCSDGLACDARRTKIRESLGLISKEKRKCTSTYSHSTHGKLTCEKDVDHLNRAGDVEHYSCNVKWMSI